MVNVDKTTTCSVGGACGVGALGLFCPICIPAISAFLASVGLGVLARAPVLWVLVALMGAILLLGLLFGWRRHRNILPLLLGGVGITAVTVGAYVLFRPTVTNLGVAAVVAATVWNLLLCKGSRRPRSSTS